MFGIARPARGLAPPNCISPGMVDIEMAGATTADSAGWSHFRFFLQKTWSLSDKNVHDVTPNWLKRGRDQNKQCLRNNLEEEVMCFNWPRSPTITTAKCKYNAHQAHNAKRTPLLTGKLAAHVNIKSWSSSNLPNQSWTVQRELELSPTACHTCTTSLNPQKYSYQWTWQKPMHRCNTWHWSVN